MWLLGDLSHECLLNAIALWVLRFSQKGRLWMEWKPPCLIRIH